MDEFQEIDYEIVVVKPWRKIIKTILNTHKGKRNILIMLISIIGVSALEILFPLLDKEVIKRFFETDNPDFSLVKYFSIAYVLIGVVLCILVLVFITFGVKVQNNVSYQLRKEAFMNLQKLSFSYFDRTPQGWIMARLTSDANRLSEIVSWGLIDLSWSFVTMVVIVIVLFVINAKLALLVMCIVPFMFVSVMILRKKMLKAYRKAREYNSQVTAAYNEGFMGSKTTKSLVIEEQSKQEFKNKVLQYRKFSIKAAIFSALFGPIVFFLGYLGVGGTLTFNVFFAGTVVLSELYIFVNYSIRFFDPIMNFSRIIGDFQQAHASAERIISLIETKPDIVDSEEVIEKYGTIFNPKYENFEELHGEIEFKDVTFKYDKGETVLKDFNLHIKKGESVALVGHTGSGKSTIVNLICRFYEPTSGTILIDNKDYKERSITWLHHNLGYVLQSPQLFSGTIKDNIRYGNLNATDEEIINAAKIVNADEFIEKLDNKYLQEVGESGSKLSLGEKQLISFARAIIADPKILILDEATSSVDSKTEYLIQEAINKVLKGRTSFIIAHRLSTIVRSDLILVMKDGQIIEKGKHHDLLLKKGYYFELYKNQFMKEKEEEIISKL